MATNFAKASYDEIYDFGTVAGKTTVIGIHTPSLSSGGTAVGPRQMLSGFFSQFRKFRYAGCKVTLVPAAQLPADPLQVSFEAGAVTIDPRDLLNPILFHGCHGENLNIALNRIMSDSVTEGENGGFSVSEGATSTALIGNEYYSALTDRSWRKFSVQSPAQLPPMRPMVWNAGTVAPMIGQYGSMQSFDLLNTISNQLKGAGQEGLDDGFIHDGMLFNPGMQWASKQDVGIAYRTQRFMSTGLVPLGWLPTSEEGDISGTSPTGQPVPVDPVLPKLFMGVLLFPPSYTQELYFRMTITHYFQFKDFQGVSLGSGIPSDTYSENLPTTRSLSIESLDENDTIRLTARGVR